MNKLQSLINQHCPNGIKYEVLKKVVLKNTFKQIGANELEEMIIFKNLLEGGGKAIT